KILDMIELQDRDNELIKNPNLLTTSNNNIEAKSNTEGYIKSINAESIGKCAFELGAGRETLDSKIDLSTGIVLNKKIDDYVEVNETLAYIHTNNMEIGEKIKIIIHNINIIGSRNKY